MKLPGVLKDKRVQLGAAAAAVLGLVVLLRKGGAPDEGGGQPIQPATLDTTGSDLYNAIQSIGQGWGNDLREFTDQLTEIEKRLGEIQKPQNGPTPTPPTGPVTGRPVPPGSAPAPKPAPRKKTSPKPPAAYATVAKYTGAGSPWNSTLGGIAKRYKTSVSALMRLNPQIRNANLVHPNQRIRVR